MRDLNAALARRREQGLYRSRRILGGPQTPRQQIDGREVLSFCSNDYLGLANHPEVVAAFHRGIDHYGAGSGSAHLVNGHSAAHEALEEELADFVGRPRALLFSTGYMANLGVATALCERGDVVLEDRLNHASLLDAGLLSGARFQRYAHADAVECERRLASHQDKHALILTDGLFSMDGDVAPLAELAAAANKHDAWLVVDDAHGLGVLGEAGRGTLEYLGVDDADVPVLVGTLGKGFGTFGAFVAGDDDLIETLIQQARTYIYTTAPPPAVAEATRQSLRLIREEPWRRAHLQTLIKQLRKGAQQIGLELSNAVGPIQPVMIGAPEAAVACSEQLLANGILIGAIRPPTVPAGTSRLRITLSASHSADDVELLLNALSTIVPLCAQAEC
ncbi:MAG TPA: 8-amino-7-oxononanoate synthase [Chromatiaceae bacterium]|nr:8-amino-7-oxononanoate synthase [Chromatiaceae bacterium]HIN82224.1 8-amino-7-oxononanoate synthase [Chromatiales bacterium]HIO54771.1 8-amino-7-oxononanoate synthase [Chromatiales bacterium]